MADKLGRKILAGGFIAILSLFTIFGSALIAFVRPLEPHLIGLVVTFGVLGLALFVTGKCRPVAAGAGKRPQGGPPGETAGREKFDAREHPLVFFEKLDFWGASLMASALPILVFNSSHLRVKHPPPPPAPKLPPPQIVVAEPVRFPPMNLQGVVCNGTKSTAVIDGQVVQVGEDLHGVLVVAVDPTGVMLELQGTTNRLTLKN